MIDKRKFRYQHNCPTDNPIEKLKNKLADNDISMIEFHSAFYLKFSKDDYPTFLKKMHYFEIWTKPMELADGMLDQFLVDMGLSVL